VPIADIRALAASTVRSNRGSIEVGDLEEANRRLTLPVN
jgi:hypothetical protein